MEPKYKVLVIEDSPIQLDWAKKELSAMPVQVVFASSFSEARDKFKNQDFILTDLELPNHKGEQPSWENGLRLFLASLNRFGQKKELKGLALVSNLNLHGETISHEDRYEISNRLTHIDWVCHKPYENFEIRCGRVNIFLLLDLARREYPNHYHKRLGAITRSQWEGLNEDEKENCTPLKPWATILRTLIEGSKTVL
ncbi:MAG: response regulator [Candidatus Moranbacteria bacterium]|nr:response regulator [Candidatus Moranbacteria bacterium]